MADEMTVAAGQLRAFVERIESIFGEIDELSGHKKEIYGEAEHSGIDKNALSKVVSFRRRRAKNPERADEQDAVVQLYLDLLDGQIDTVPHHARIHAREFDRLSKARAEMFKRLSGEREDDRTDGRSKSVYFIHARESGMVKIGVSYDVNGRLATLQTASSAPLKLLLSFPGDHRREAELHETFASARIHGEWFSTEDGRIMEFIADAKAPHLSIVSNEQPAKSA